VITTTEPFENLNTVAQAVMDKARASGKFYFVDADLKIDEPQATLVVDRDKLSTLARIFHAKAENEVGGILISRVNTGA
jgi:multidrug efflux pump subunit AcrB